MKRQTVTFSHAESLSNTSKHYRTDCSGDDCSDGNPDDVAFGLIRSMTDIVVEVADAAPPLAKAAHAIAQTLPIRNHWAREALSVCCLSATAFAILAYSSLKIEGQSRRQQDRKE